MFDDYFDWTDSTVYYQSSLNTTVSHPCSYPSYY